MAEQSKPDAAQAGGPPETIVYGATGGRKTFFSFLFLILLPFFISLPAMFITRINAGLWGDAAGHAVMALAFGALMFLVFIELMFSLRARIELGPEKMKLTLPSGRGPTPMLRYRSYELPYADVTTVETRREIYGGSMVPVLLQGARLITKDDQKIPLGYVSEANLDPAFPFAEIAQKIAERARLPVIDRGSVWRSVRRKFLGWGKTGLIDTSTVDETQIAALNHSHRNVVMAVIGGLAVLIAIGIVDDLSSDLPIGQTASTIVSNAPAAAPAAKKTDKAEKPAKTGN